MSNSNLSTFSQAGGAMAPSGARLLQAGARIAAVHQPALPVARLVEAVLDELVDGRESFTAYDVTMILRALIPPAQRLLPHYDRPGAPGVQPEVHRQMAGYLISGIYTQHTAYPNGVDPARLYVPVARRGHVVASNALSAPYLSDEEWDSVSPLLPPQKPPVGRPNVDHRTVVGGILWVQRTGHSWRQLPVSFGKWSTVYSRYRRWQHIGLWQDIEAALAA